MPRVKHSLKGPGTDIRPRGLVAQLNPGDLQIGLTYCNMVIPFRSFANHQSPSSPHIFCRGRYRCGSTRCHPRVISIESAIVWRGRTESGARSRTDYSTNQTLPRYTSFFDPSFFCFYIHGTCAMLEESVDSISSRAARRTIGSSTTTHLLHFSVSMRSETSPLRPSLRFAIIVPDIFPLALPPVMAHRRI
jgi:hypothetical protein